MKCKLKIIRKAKNITQKELADKLNVKQTTISEWENNNNYPNIEKAYRLANILNLTVNDIWK